MEKAEFLLELSARLQALPETELEKTLAYYSESIDDRVEDGMTIAQAIEALGNPDEIARGVLGDTPLKTLVKTRFSKRLLGRGRLSGVLIALGFPVWFPLLAALTAVVLSGYAALGACIVSVYAVLAALLVSGFGGLVFCVSICLQGAALANCLCMAGLSLSALGAGMLLFRPVNAAARGLFFAGRVCVRGAKTLFLSKRREPA